jgi:excisionase family DNA binding protein
VVRPIVRLLTVREVAEHLALSTATVYAMIERGELAHARVSNSIRITPAELDRYLTEATR